MFFLIFAEFSQLLLGLPDSLISPCMFIVANQQAILIRGPRHNLVVEPTPLNNISQNGNLPQIGVNIENIWNHHLGLYGCNNWMHDEYEKHTEDVFSTAVAETSELVFVFLHASIFSHGYNTALSV